MTTRPQGPSQDAVALLAGQNRVLEKIARGEELRTVLEDLVLAMESHLGGMLCSVLLLDEDRRHLRLGAAPNLPVGWNQLVDGLEIGEGVGSCGTAAHRGTRVLVTCIATDPLYAPYKDAAAAYSLGSSWSEPILDSAGQVLGTFAIYDSKPRSPTSEELHIIATAAHIAGIAIERERVQAERTRLMTQVQQSQKLDSLGLLAGGIAHDFNNLLVGILGNAGLALQVLPPGAAGRNEVEAIEQAAVRAREMTQQLLAYSGRGKFVIEPIDLSTVVEETSQLVRMAITAKASLRFDFAPSLPAVEADPTQIRQVIMNLITNAAEALGADGGVVQVRTGALDLPAGALDDTWFRSEALPAGHYVYFEIEDAGTGMSRETLARIFDPFYSTKFAGRGLGLAAVQGIVHGQRGAIWVRTEIGRGTSFRVVLPSSPHPARAAEQRPFDEADEWTASGAILVIDDDDMVRRVARRVLERSGFWVLDAGSGAEGVEIFREHPEDVAAVLLDLTMPQMDGKATFRALRAISPEVPVLLMSGYAKQDADQVPRDGPCGFVQKPFQASDLVEQLRQLVD